MTGFELSPEEVVRQTAQHLAGQATPEGLLLSRILKLESESGTLVTQAPNEDRAMTAQLFNSSWAYAHEDLSNREPRILELVNRTIAVRGLTCVVVAQLSHVSTDGYYNGLLKYGSGLPVTYDEAIITTSGAVGFDRGAQIVAGAETGRLTHEPPELQLAESRLATYPGDDPAFLAQLQAEVDRLREGPAD